MRGPLLTNTVGYSSPYITDLHCRRSLMHCPVERNARTRAQFIFRLAARIIVTLQHDATHMVFPLLAR